MRGVSWDLTLTNLFLVIVRVAILHCRAMTSVEFCFINRRVNIHGSAPKETLQINIEQKSQKWKVKVKVKVKQINITGYSFKVTP